MNYYKNIGDIIISVALLPLVLIFLAKMWGKGMFGFKSNMKRIKDLMKK